MARASSSSLVATATVILLAACQNSANGETEQIASRDAHAPLNGRAEDARPEETQRIAERVRLTREERNKLGIITRAAREVQYRPELAGFGVVQERQPIVQAVADTLTAQTNVLYSKRSLERAQQLKGTPGALSADLEQSVEQKEAVDSTTLSVARNKLSTLWGPSAPWKDNIRDSRVVSLVRGESLLVRVSIPLNTLTDLPAGLAAGRLGSPRTEARLTLEPVWVAPSDVNIPGSSLFAMVPAGKAVEGEHLQVWIPNGPAIAGVLVPAEGAVLHAGRFWCYLERASGTFERVPIQTDRALSGGYVVTEGVKAGDAVVSAGVAHLLAKESGSADESD